MAGMTDLSNEGRQPPTTASTASGLRPSVPEPSPPTAPVGLLAGRYRLTRILGSGGAAIVWEAHDEKLGRRVAVKMLHPHLLRDEASHRRFVAEARAAAQLSHPAIVEVHDIVVDGPSTAIVLELIEGESLSERIARDGVLPPAEAARIGRDIAEALDHAHRSGILHCDVKPANVLLGSDGRPRLVDFGIARALDEPGSAMTATGSIMGTLRYMAPEQLVAEPFGPSADIFALGAVLYETLAGVPAFGATSPVALVREHGLGPPRLPAVPGDLAGIVEAMLGPDPEHRPADAGMVAAALDAWLAGGLPSRTGGLPSRTGGLPSRTGGSPSRTGTANADDPHGSPGEGWVRRIPAVMAGTMGTLVLLFGVLALDGPWRDPLSPLHQAVAPDPSFAPAIPPTEVPNVPPDPPATFVPTTDPPPAEALPTMPPPAEPPPVDAPPTEPPPVEQPPSDVAVVPEPDPEPAPGPVGEAQVVSHPAPPALHTGAAQDARVKERGEGKGLSKGNGREEAGESRGKGKGGGNGQGRANGNGNGNGRQGR
jgi:eukaryotic-like serine/threonine-protein kinase